jgi:SAM-dependent methyltransferase
VPVLRSLLNSIQDGSAPAVLERLILGQQEIKLQEIEKGIPLPLLDELLINGFLIEREEKVYCPFIIQFCKGLCMISDRMEHADCRGFVLPIGPASLHLTRLAIRKRVSTTLDMGCGSGIQALLASRHTAQVIATDINPRALAFTRLNAAINDIANIELLEGSYFEPVMGKNFDLILFNPPYILSPDADIANSYAYCTKDDYLFGLLQNLPEHLNEGGFAQLTANWTHTKQGSWRQPLQTALAGLGLDALIIYQGSLTPAQYAAYWFEHDIARDAPLLKRFYRSWKWANWLRHQRVGRVAFGSLTLRRRSSTRNWCRAEMASNSFGESVSAQLVNLFTNQDILEEQPFKDDILNMRLTLERSLFNPNSEPQRDLPLAVAGIVFPLRIHNITWRVLELLDGKEKALRVARKVIQAGGYKEGDLLPAVMDDLMRLFQFGWLKVT